jgi:hypothetical protein
MQLSQTELETKIKQITVQYVNIIYTLAEANHRTLIESSTIFPIFRVTIPQWSTVSYASPAAKRAPLPKKLRLNQFTNCQLTPTMSKVTPKLIRIRINLWAT